jgi:hypothetical protein
MTGDDVLAAEAACCSFLAPLVEADWGGAVPGLDHTGASVVAHAASGPLWYALDLCGGPDRQGGDDAAFDLTVRAAAANIALVASLRSAARVCAASVDAAPAGMRGFHPAGCRRRLRFRRHGLRRDADPYR